MARKPPPTILLVDDDPLIRKLGRELLENLGFAVKTAAEPYSALEVYRRLPGVDLVIMDYQLPGMDGCQLLEELRRLDARVRVLVASGFLAPRETARLRQSGVQGIIYKPYRLTELRQRIQAALAAASGD